VSVDGACDGPGYVPVVNRGQKDIDTNKPITRALEYERQFFENHPAYASKAQYCGTPFLARKLNLVRGPPYWQYRAPMRCPLSRACVRVDQS
jgi:hypothetical protein